MDLAAAYAACAAVTKREAKNFYYAFLSLPKPQRLAVYALYAFCREADDCVDGDASTCVNSLSPCVDGDASTCVNSLSPCVDGDASTCVDSLPSCSDAEAKRRGMAALRARLASAAKGDPQTDRDGALADAIDRFGVDPDDLADVLRGVEMDLEVNRIVDVDGLRTYCYHVASAVGLATLPILNAGVPPTDAMRDDAIALGLGMQFVNILRDVREDLESDRIYLPTDEMARFGVGEDDLRAGQRTEPVRALLAFQADRARRTLADGLRLVGRLPRAGRACPWLLAAMYGRILERIVARNYDVWSERISLTKREKLWLLLASHWRA